ncbi:hypothetical protein DPMN_146083 [Dreissena polymorpha]|uniref:Uncharacterized protein n=1 Tax=Dreissena polymorpha TaxID=45954 RepID=A0A9D4FB51_DREPO|nr:hypothetical protein DPMN_146083 [Dreissena polymorpha]
MPGVYLFLPISEGSSEDELEILEGTKIINSQKVQLCYNARLHHRLFSLDRPIPQICGQEYSIRNRLLAGFCRCASSFSQISIHNVTLTFLKFKVPASDVGTSDTGTTFNCGQFYGFELSIETFD